MAVQAKLTIKRGQRAQDVVLSAGDAISGSDAMELNIDATLLPKVEALLMLDALKQRIHEHGWPQDGS